MPRRKRVLDAGLRAQLKAAVDALYTEPCSDADLVPKHEVYTEVFVECGLPPRSADDWLERQVLAILRKKGMAKKKCVRIAGKVTQCFHLRRADDHSLLSLTRQEELDAACAAGQDDFDRLQEARRDEERQRRRERLPRGSTRSISRSRSRGPMTRGVTYSSNDFLFE
jgi:hypothetical protein